MLIAYNGDGHRVWKDDGTDAKRFLYDGNTLLREVDDLGLLEAEYTYTPQPYGHLISQERAGDSSFYHFDGIGNVRALTDNLGVQTDEYLYDAWGKVFSTTGTTSNPFTYKGEAGYYRDPDLGPENDNYTLHHRHYAAGSGRFWSMDPARDDANLYRYVRNNPVNSRAPSGLADLPENKQLGLPSVTVQPHEATWYTTRPLRDAKGNIIGEILDLTPEGKQHRAKLDAAKEQIRRNNANPAVDKSFFDVPKRPYSDSVGDFQKVEDASDAEMRALHEKVHAAALRREAFRESMDESTGGLYSQVIEAGPIGYIEDAVASQQAASRGEWGQAIVSGGRAALRIAGAVGTLRGLSPSRPTGRGAVDDGAFLKKVEAPAVTKPSGFEPHGFTPPAGTRKIPKDIPNEWRIRPTQGEGGVWYYDPKNKGNAVRVMPGEPHSPFPKSQVPYVRWQKNGQPLDASGGILPTVNLLMLIFHYSSSDLIRSSSND
jgi:RHS repeat-associated protein